MASTKTSVTSSQIGVAIEAFLTGMRREFISRHGPEAECRVPIWSQMTKEDRGVLVRSMRSALTAAMDEDTISRFRERAREAAE